MDLSRYRVSCGALRCDRCAEEAGDGDIGDNQQTIAELVAACHAHEVEHHGGMPTFIHWTPSDPPELVEEWRRRMLERGGEVAARYERRTDGDG